MRCIVLLAVLAVLVIVARSRATAEVWHTLGDQPPGP